MKTIINTMESPLFFFQYMADKIITITNKTIVIISVIIIYFISNIKNYEN